jgi:hypothetical protein
VEDVLARPIEDRPGSEGSRVALGQTEAGRYLKVIYVPDPEPGSVFVITAYDLGPKAARSNCGAELIGFQRGEMQMPAAPALDTTGTHQPGVLQSDRELCTWPKPRGSPRKHPR